MERLTYVKDHGWWNHGKHPTKYSSRHSFQEVVARLAAYEDTGLTPEEIKTVQDNLTPIPFSRYREIMEAERAGRLMVLPCKVGDINFVVIDGKQYGIIEKNYTNDEFERRILSAQNALEAAMKGGAE